MINRKLLLLASVATLIGVNQAFAGTFNMEILSGGQQVCKLDNEIVSCDQFFGEGEDKINDAMREVEDKITNATCEVNGKQVPCDQAVNSMKSFFGGFAIVFLILGLVSIILTVFWIWMLVDVINHQHKDKTMRMLVVVLLGGLGAIIYYFTARKERSKAAK